MEEGHVFDRAGAVHSQADAPASGSAVVSATQYQPTGTPLPGLMLDSSKPALCLGNGTQTFWGYHPTSFLSHVSGRELTLFQLQQWILRSYANQLICPSHHKDWLSYGHLANQSREGEETCWGFCTGKRGLCSAQITKKKKKSPKIPTSLLLESGV